MKNINIMEIVFPEEFEILQSLPEDPELSVSYGKELSGSLGFFQSFPISSESAMPMDDNKNIIDGIHDCLAENQGLVEVNNGTTKNGKQYVYSIVKSAKEPSGMIYILTLHFLQGNDVMCVRGQFEEIGTTGIRDASVYEYCRRENIIKGEGSEGWFIDPYDAEFTYGLRMNLSENEVFDNSFPEHPLTQLRLLISYLVNNN